MNSGLQFDEEISRKVESLYMTPDVVAQRHQVLKALALREGERVLDIGSGRPSRSGAKAYPGKRRTLGLLNSPNWTSRESFSSVSIVIFLLRTSRRLLESRLGGVVHHSKFGLPMSALGQKRTSEPVRVMSALVPT